MVLGFTYLNLVDVTYSMIELYRTALLTANAAQLRSRSNAVEDLTESGCDIFHTGRQNGATRSSRNGILKLRDASLLLLMGESCSRTYWVRMQSCSDLW